MTADDAIRQVLAEHGRLAVDATCLGEDADLYSNGLSSYATVNVMLALEATFDVEFPDKLLRKDTFVSIAAIREALVSLGCAGEVLP